MEHSCSAKFLAFENDRQPPARGTSFLIMTEWWKRPYQLLNFPVSSLIGQKQLQKNNYCILFNMVWPSCSVGLLLSRK